VPNRLAGSSSPYLRQHADNPVDWQPWGDAAFARARAEDRPIFLSIGYATCHWCHVMAHESFEDPAVAALMNDAFVNIKVDREERPDVDQVYMTVCQLLTGSGGWPLTILMTPDRRPFFAATYIPRDSRHGRAGMLELVPRVQALWRTDRVTLLDSASQVVSHLEAVAGRPRAGAVPAGLVERAFHQLAASFDAAHGGFGDRPKFPSPHNLVFLLQHWSRTGAEDALSMAVATLRAMRRGGIWDHVGFGFHRYSTDPQWMVPHFEKMLYDQAMHALAYTEAFQATGEQEYARTAREIAAYVMRDMEAADGGFYSAEDADSEGEEGVFYLWNEGEIRSLLDAPLADLAIAAWGVTRNGNYHDESTGRRTGANILHLRESARDAAARLGLDPTDFEERLESARAALLTARERRERPLQDDKVLADWNGLMAAALARVGRVLGARTALDAARRAAERVHRTLRSPGGALLHHAGAEAVPGFLDDYAFLTWAWLELYDATLEPECLARALDLQQEALDRFWDDVGGGFFFAAHDSEPLLVRDKEFHDGAIPSGNSVAMANLVRLARLTGRADLAVRAEAVAAAAARDLQAAPAAHCHLLATLQMAAGPSLEIVIVGDAGDPATQRLLEVVRSRYLPDAVLLLIPEGEPGRTVRALAPFTEQHTRVGGRPAAYLCRDFACRLPTSDPEELRRLIDEVAPPRALPNR